MEYRVREGILLKNICGEWLLIAVGEASKHCLYVRQINDTLAWFWKRIAENNEIDAIVSQAEEYFDAPRTKIEEDLKALIENLRKMGYLIELTNNE